MSSFGITIRSLHDALPISGHCSPALLGNALRGLPAVHHRVVEANRRRHDTATPYPAADSATDGTAAVCRSRIWRGCVMRSEEHKSELQSRCHLVRRRLLDT